MTEGNTLQEDNREKAQESNEIRSSKEPKNLGEECPYCHKISYHKWVLDTSYGMCIACGQTWLLKKSTS